jgi:hypothetical protein
MKDDTFLDPVRWDRDDILMHNEKYKGWLQPTL